MNITLKYMSNYINNVSDAYLMCLRRIRLNPNKNAKKTLYDDYQETVEDAFDQLDDDDDRRIINNDFFKNAYLGWWMEYYSRATYYRLRKRAITRFFEILRFWED